jgi:HemY protein
MLLIALAALAIAVPAALLVREDSGYLYAAYGHWSLETSLSFFLLLVTLAFGAFYLSIRLLARVWAIPRRFNAWDRRRSARRARRQLIQGLVESAEGRWAQAEKTLLRLVDEADIPLLNYLAAARCAQQQGAHERRDRYLQLAHESTAGADLAVGLTQAELQLGHDQYEQALATLNHLREFAPAHNHVLGLLQLVYRRLGDWPRLRELLPELRKRRVLDEEALSALEIQVYQGLLEQAAGSPQAERLAEAWAQVPKALRGKSGVLKPYIGALSKRGQPELAEPLLRAAIGQTWDAPLVRLYGLLLGPDPAKQLATAEAWLPEHTESAALLLTLGRLSLHNRLWGKARSYLEAAIEFGAGSEACRDLARLLESLGEAQPARALYRKALEQSVGPAPELPLPSPRRRSAPAQAPEPPDVLPIEQAS